jgi:hypothetical protein
MMMIKWALSSLVLLSCWRQFSIATAVKDVKKGSNDQHRALQASTSSSSTTTMTNKGSITTMIATVVPPTASSSSWFSAADEEEETTSENNKERRVRSLQGTAPAPASPMAPSTSTTTETTSYDYLAAYTAQVQHISTDALCTGGRPEVRVLCGGEIRFVNATWPNSIKCATFAVEESTVDWAEAGLVDTDRYRNGLHCTIDCESANECNLFTQDIPDLEWARAAQVNYECAGNAYNDIATLLVVSKAQSTSTTPYTCPNDPDTTPAQGHYARLGVLCEGDTVSYDIFLFECVSPSFRVFTSNENTLGIGEQLVCVTLDSCNINWGNVCDCADTTNSCPLQLSDVGVLADIYQFPPSCVTTKAGVTVPAAPPAPAPVENNNNANLVVTARFWASWSLYSDDAVTSSNRCTIDSTVALVECTRSGDTISLLESAGSVKCTNKSDRALSCVDSAANFVGDYASFVDYVRSYVLVALCFVACVFYALLPRAHNASIHMRVHHHSLTYIPATTTGMHQCAGVHERRAGHPSPVGPDLCHVPRRCRPNGANRPRREPQPILWKRRFFILGESLY